jgi:Uma2 family endonuclease
MVTHATRRRFTVAEYEEMASAGILHEDDRVELIMGEVVEMSPIGGRHIACVNRLNRLLNRHLDERFIVSVQNPLRLSPNSEPQPDLAILNNHDYGGEPPTAADALLVIEVADSSRDYDRGTKLPIYAAAGIAESWLIDLVAGGIERHTEPGANGYRLIARAGRGESLASVVVPALTLSVDAVLS